MSIDDDIGRAIRQQEAEERELRIRLEELRWVVDAMVFPNEALRKVEQRIKLYETQLERASYYGD
jgi:hypothetical protein